MATYNFTAKSGYTFQDSNAQYPWAKFVRDPEADTPRQAPKMVHRTVVSPTGPVAWPAAAFPFCGDNGYNPLRQEDPTTALTELNSPIGSVTRRVVDADESMIQPGGIASRTYRFSTSDPSVRDRLNAASLLAATADITLVSTT